MGMFGQQPGTSPSMPDQEGFTGPPAGAARGHVRAVCGPSSGHGRGGVAD
ncbi:hypothetical protein AS9A_4563 [Hoyosella subflava DQS3-9A1]|uniref:Uncharacterized protein n=1 Tax=Hoyosella subflava (strain DSM 45089 / JCM 17490 / NBRC 109087 / DQS3-9A1) TaxID=443218 RepID=F6EPE6_HOYSD|nr:hypothetical protein AS9A_4563 [Hoyosella subflava DQS3-9A1]